MIVFVLKIPLSPPFPKGGVKDIFIFLCEPMARVISSEGGNPDGVLIKHLNTCFRRHDLLKRSFQ